MRTRLDGRLVNGPMGLLTLTLSLFLFLALGAGRLRADSLYGIRSQEFRDGEGVLVGSATFNDALGRAIAIGDFNGDGRDDVAAFDEQSAPGEQGCGAVHVVYGSGAGLSGATDQLWVEFDPELLLLDRQAAAEFGQALVAGHFNGDSYDDLAIGVPWRDIEGVSNAGWVIVVYGSAAGLQTDTAPLPRRFALGINGVLGGPRAEGDRMGWALAAGDFDGSGVDDLAIGIPGKGVGALDGAGKVLVLYGLAGGLSIANQRVFDQDSFDGGGSMAEVAEADDEFGTSLTAGDFDADGIDDLAIGVPLESLPGGTHQGFVHVIYGSSANGLRMLGNEGFSQTGTDSGDLTEHEDHFGFVLAAGDLTGDGAAELVIGSPFENFEGDVTVADAGSITVLYGQVGIGIETAFSESYFEEDFNVGAAVQTQDWFGGALAIGNFVSTTFDRPDLAIGIPRDKVWNGFQTLNDAGSVIVTGQNGVFLGSVQDRRWAQGYGGSAGELTTHQLYGTALGAGDFDGDGHGDLVVGAPGFDLGSVHDVGALYSLYGAMFSDGFETDDTSAWSAVVP